MLLDKQLGGTMLLPIKKYPTSEYFTDIQRTRNSQLTVHH